MIKLDVIFQEYYMRYGVAIFGYIWLYIFAVNIIQQRSIRGVSILAIFIHLAVSTQWMVYGQYRDDWVIRIGSIISILGNLCILTAIMYIYSQEGFVKEEQNSKIKK